MTRAYVWLVGSLNAADWRHAWPLAAAVAALVPALLALGRRIDGLAFGDDVARALGLGVERLAFSPTEIPVGIVTSMLAAPYFLYLLRK